MTHKQIFVKMLKEAGSRGVLTTQFKKVSSHHSARLSELAKEGYVIKATKVDEKNWRYVLIRIPDEEKRQKKAIEVLKEALGDDFEAIKRVLDSYGLQVAYKAGKLKEGARVG